MTSKPCHTGQFCGQAGSYRSSCACGVVRTFARGDEAPRCPRCRRGVDWHFESAPSGAPGASPRPGAPRA